MDINNNMKSSFLHKKSLIKKRLFTMFFLIFLIFSWFFFYQITKEYNYPLHRKWRMELIEHPEFIPSTKIVKLTSAWHENLISDFFWLSSIQYIWSNAISSEYKKYLYAMLDLVTDLNPNFTYPYQIWELLLSSFNERYETDKEWQKKYIEQSIKLWLKWIEKNCDMKKVKAIKDEVNLWLLWTDERYKNPCLDPQIPYYLAYIYYWNKYDGKTASYYYKITAANENTVIGARIMAAIMQWKGWDRQKAVLMFLSLAQALSNEKAWECKKIAGYLGEQFNIIFGSNYVITWDSIKKIEELRQNAVNELKDSGDDLAMKNEYSCSAYLNKATREINMYFIEKANEQYKAKKWINARNAKVLFDEKFIDYIPSDFQNDKNKDYSIIYYFNEETKNWDYKFWYYKDN